MAKNIVEGKGLTMNGRLPARYPPGFPVCLAAEFLAADRLGVSRPTMVIFTNVVLIVLSSVLVFLIASSILTERAALIAALLWASYPFSLWLLKQPNSEVPFIAVLYLATWLFFLGVQREKLTFFALAGLLVGGAALIRPAALPIPALLAVMLLIYQKIPFGKRALGAALIPLAFGLAILPWEMELWKYNGKVLPLSTGGTPTILVGFHYPVKYQGRGMSSIPAGVARFVKSVEEKRESLVTTGDIGRFLAAQMRSDPVSVLEMAAVKLARSWYGTDSLLHEVPIALVQAAYFALVLTGLLLSWRRFPDRRFVMTTLIAIVLCFWGMTTMVLSILRYMAPAMGFLMVFAAVALDSGLARWVIPGVNSPPPR